jgi:CHC2 zinc finger/Toprim-like
MLPMGFRAPVNTWQMTARGPRIDWSDVKDRIDLAAVATSLLGPAPGRRAGQGRLWWKCPFHDDKNPSFHVNPTKQTWKCYGCSEHGDAAALVMRLKHCTFPEAVAHLAGKPAPEGKPTHPRPAAASPPVKPAAGPVKQSSGLPLADAQKLVEEAAARLWTPEGGEALAYLRGRGLTEATIKTASLGWTPRVSIPVKDGKTFWDVSGIVIPWLDRDRLAMVKIRRPAGSEPKYAEAFRDRPAIFPAPEAVRPGMPLVVVEGEFDCLLLAQELADLAAVVTLGSASARPEGSTYLAMLPAPTWHLAHDADEAGDKAASGWPARARRVRPPAPCKDWTEAFQYPINLLRWWTDRLGGIEAPALSSWDELASRRWGPAIGDLTPGIIIDGRSNYQ